MLGFDDIRHLVSAARDASPAARELADALADGTEAFEQLGPGRDTARGAAATFTIRERTARNARIDTCGMREAIEALERLPLDAAVQLFHYTSPTRYFTIFAHAGKLVACIRVTRKGAHPG